MSHHHQRDVINKDDAERLKLPSPVATGTMPSPLALPPPVVACSPASSSVISPRTTNTEFDPAALPLAPASASSSPSSAAADSPVPGPARCTSCRKRLGLAGFRCRCGSLFCATHRYSDRHACTFDYKAQAREAIARDNPVYKAPKLLKI